MVTRTIDQNSQQKGMWNAICDRCGLKFKNVDLRKEWNGLMTCRDCWEPRHPQDTIEVKEDRQTVPWNRPDSNTNTNTTDINGNAIVTDVYRDLYGDENATLTWGTGNTLIEFGTDLTANRLVSFLGSPSDGDRYIITRTGGGAYTLTILGVRTIPASVKAVVEAEYRDSAWREVSYTTIGL